MSKGNMLFNRSKNWGCEENEKIGMLLFVQRTRELLLHTTSIASKPHFTSPLVIARELLFIFSQNSKTPHTSTESNITHLVGELLESLSFDEIAKEAIGDRLNHIERCLLDFSASHLQIETASFLINRFSIRNYVKQCSTRVIRLIEEGGRKKRDLLNLSEAFISAIKEAGYPTQTIYHLLNVAFVDYERTPMSARVRLEKFFSNFDFALHNYVVGFGLSDIADDVNDTFQSVGGVLLKKDSKEYDDFCLKLREGNKNFLLRSDPDALVTFDDIRALDPQSARVEAERRLHLLDDLLRFSVHKKRFSVKNQAIVSNDKTGLLVNSNRPKAPVLLVPHETDVEHTGLKNLAIALRRARGGSNERFVRAIELHGTALSAIEDESQLLNIWIALETLFVTGKSGSKIKEIVSCIEPYVLATWNQYIFAELWEQVKLNHLKIWSASTEGVTDFADKSPEAQFIMSIAIKKFEPSMTLFLKELDSDPLLRCKITECIGWAQNAKTIRDYVDKIHKKILNDINRIYRTRNQLVHTGGSKGNLSDVVQSAHHYLDLAITLLSFMLGQEHGFQTIEQSNLETRIRLEEFQKDLNQMVAQNSICDESNFAKLLFGRHLLA